MSTELPPPDPDGLWRGVGGLVLEAGLRDGHPVINGQWGRTGLGYGVASMEEVAHMILAACAKARGMAGQDGESDD